ncbi:MAG: transglycosylase SLT domain-containing protein, partial [Herbaspirillum sp.]
MSSKRLAGQTSRHATWSHQLLLVGGALAIGMLVTFLLKPELGERIHHWSPSMLNVATSTPNNELDNADLDAGLDPNLNTSLTSNAKPSLTVPDSTLAHVASTKAKQAQTGADNSLQQRWVTQWLSKRYRVAQDATSMMVKASYNTAKEMKLDPLLILAVMAIESGFNPVAESASGAQGLMQVMSSVHQAKFQKLGGVQAALNPVANIKVGSSI